MKSNPFTFAKLCPVCGRWFVKPYTESVRAWFARHKFCCKACFIEDQKHRTSWNKGRPWTREERHVLSVVHKGQHNSPATEHKKGWQNPFKGKMWLENRGANHPCYKGTTPEQTILRMRVEYANWRREVFARDDYTCQCCGERGGLLQAHHLESFVDHPELRYVTLNGVTLCKKCHKAFHDSFGRGKNTSQQYRDWLEMVC